MIGKIIDSISRMVRNTRARTVDDRKTAEKPQSTSKVAVDVVYENGSKKRRVNSVDAVTIRFDQNRDDVRSGKRERRAPQRYQAIDFIYPKVVKPEPAPAKRPRKNSVTKAAKPSTSKKTDTQKSAKNLKTGEETSGTSTSTENGNIAQASEDVTMQTYDDFMRRIKDIPSFCTRLMPNGNSIKTEDFDLVRISFNDSIVCYKSEDGFYFLTLGVNSGITHLRPHSNAFDKSLVRDWNKF
jgi:hypothetical protein